MTKKHFNYVVAAFGFMAAIFLNPSADKHRTVFVDYAHSHFFELRREYQKIFEQLRAEGADPKKYQELFYGNFLVFSTLTYVGRKEERHLLSIGALGFVVPMVN